MRAGGGNQRDPRVRHARDRAKKFVLDVITRCWRVGAKHTAPALR
jgi:hypothetical protein